jgi:protein TonB
MRPPAQWVENTKLVREPPLEAREPLLPPRKAVRSPKLAFILAAAGLHIGCLAASATFVRSLRPMPQDDPAVVEVVTVPEPPPAAPEPMPPEFNNPPQADPAPVVGSADPAPAVTSADPAPAAASSDPAPENLTAAAAEPPPPSVLPPAAEPAPVVAMADLPPATEPVPTVAPPVQVSVASPAEAAPVADMPDPTPLPVIPPAVPEPMRAEKAPPPIAIHKVLPPARKPPERPAFRVEKPAIPAVADASSSAVMTPAPAAVVASSRQVPPPTAPTADQQSELEAHIRAAVQAAVHYPPAARMMGLVGRARVLLTYRDGTAGGPAVVQTSGAQVLDEAALAAVRSAHYPPPPASIVGHAMRFLVWVEFRAG